MKLSKASNTILLNTILTAKGLQLVLVQTPKPPKEVKTVLSEFDLASLKAAVEKRTRKAAKRV